MATKFENFTSGFHVGNEDIGIQAAKITTAAEGVVTSIGTSTSEDAIPTVGAVKNAKVASATSADNAAKLNGQDASYYATSESVTTLAGRVTTAETNIGTLQGYFTNGVANEAASAAKADEAGKLSAAQTITFTGDVTGSFSFDGSTPVTTGLSVVATTAPLTANSASEKAGFAKGADVEKALAAVEAKIGEITSFEVVTDHTKVTDPKTNIIYLEGPKSSVTGDDKYEEWIYTNGDWAKIGETSIDLSNYVQKTDTTYTATTAYASDWNTYKPTVTAAVTDVATLKNASANWDTASAWVNTNGDNVTAHLADTNVHVTTAQKANWNAASAWVDANSGLVLKEVSVAGSVSGKGTSTSPIGLTTTAEDALAAVDGKLDKSEAATTYLTQSAASATYATKTAFDDLNSIVTDSTSGLVKKVGDNTTNIATVSSTVDGMKYYSKVAVKTTTGATVAVTEAGSANDTIGLYAGTGITLATSNDGGKPVVTINANAGEGVDVVGSGAVTVATATVSNVKTFTVNKTADYYDSTDGLIHLF